jgi:protease-4
MTRLSAVLVVALALGAGCGSKKSEPKDKPSGGDPWSASGGSDPTAVRPGGGASAAGGLGATDWAQLLPLIVANLDSPGPYDEPESSPGYQPGAPHVAVLELAGEVNEVRTFSFTNPTSGIELRSFGERLRGLAADPSVSGLLLRLGGLEMSIATAEEVRAALAAFRASGKALHCWGEGITNVTYYVATTCNTIGLAPGGEIVVSGVAAMPIHLKRLLDDVGVKADFLHVGAFKGAAEPLTRDRPSPEMVETMGAILDLAYETLVAGIAEGRKLSPDAVRGLIDTAMFQGEDARKASLVDTVAVFERYRDDVVAGGAWTEIELSDEKPDMTAAMRFIGAMPDVRPVGPHVALVYAVGDVVDGGKGVIGAREEIASRTLPAAIRTLAADDDVKAIVVRVDSPGGSALASEIIWHAVAEARAKKPVVVSMGAVAASGGYYISAGATKIYALANTLTGSIGVVGGKLAIGPALAKHGVDTYPLARGKRATLFSGMDPWNADERAAVQQSMDAVYGTFVNRVGAGRGKTFDQVHAIAQGRVWTGVAAKEHGLVDEIGGLDAALAEAHRLGKVAPSTPLEIYPPTPTLRDFLRSYGNVEMPFGLGSAVATLARDLAPAEARAAQHAIQQLLDFRDGAVRTTLVMPLVVR